MFLFCRLWSLRLTYFKFYCYWCQCGRCVPYSPRILEFRSAAGTLVVQKEQCRWDERHGVPLETPLPGVFFNDANGDGMRNVANEAGVSGAAFSVYVSGKLESSLLSTAL
jgi:hypothetical protein